MNFPTIVRSASAQDLPGMLPLFRHLDVPGSPAPDHTAALSAWNRLIAMDGVTVFVAEVEGVLAATCTLIIIPNVTHAARPHALIENVATLQDYRKQGLGRRVLHAAVDACWAAGCYKVVLTTGSNREATLRFYEGAGFERGIRTAFQMRRD
jgi:GNAT superfamily N-acetyltransferase